MNLNKRIEVRISEVEILKAEKVINNNPEKYDSLSHYIRCAVVRLNREELGIKGDTVKSNNLGKAKSKYR